MNEKNGKKLILYMKNGLSDQQHNIQKTHLLMASESSWLGSSFCFLADTPAVHTNPLQKVLSLTVNGTPKRGFVRASLSKKMEN